MTDYQEEYEEALAEFKDSWECRSGAFVLASDNPGTVFRGPTDADWWMGPIPSGGWPPNTARCASYEQWHGRRLIIRPVPERCPKIILNLGQP